MRTSQVFLSLALVGAAASAQELATCRNPTGRAFYHFAGAVPKADAGWTDDKIGGGIFTLTQTGETYDLLFVDTRKKPISAIQDGAIVRLLRRGPTNITVLLFYPEGAATEIYSFFKEKDGSHRFSMLQSKTGDAAPVPKSSLMVGTCDPIKF